MDGCGDYGKEAGDSPDYDTLRRVLDYPRYDDVRARASESAELKVEGVQWAMVECELLLLHMYVVYVVCCMRSYS